MRNRVCQHCGDRIKSEYGTKYCSPECFHQGHSFAGENNPNYKGGKETGECEICGTEFSYYPSEKKGHFCSECVKNEQWQTPPGLSGPDHPMWKGEMERECEVCGDTIRRTPGMFRGEAALCSKECHNVWLSESFTDEGHPNWKGGGSIYYGKGWRTAKLAALERDDRTCQICGATEADIGRNPDVHHIVPVREFAEAEDAEIGDAHSVENLICLCVTCHRNADVGNISEAELRGLVATS